ncbi:MAG: type 4a pilus biogenesis protein PilO [Pirellulales bacterium]
MKYTWIIDAFDRWGATAGLVAAAVAYCVLVDIPYSTTTAQLRKETDEHRRFIAEAERLVSQTERLERQASEAGDYIADWRRATPKAATVGQFYGEIHHAVRTAGVDVTRFEPQPAVPLAMIEQQPVSLTMEGRHADLATALVNLEKLPATIWVKDVTVTPVRERAGFVQFESKIVIFADNATKSD